MTALLAKIDADLLASAKAERIRLLDSLMRGAKYENVAWRLVELDRQIGAS